MDSSSPEISRVLFIGNSLNLLIPDNVQLSWNALLSNMEEFVREEINYEGDDRKMPFPARAARLKNFLGQKIVNGSQGPGVWEQWLTKIGKLPAGRVHFLLKALMEHYKAILTTNYDYALESVIFEQMPAKCITNGKKGNAVRCYQEKIWHIHGEAKDPQSIIMSSGDYIDAVFLLKQQVKEQENTWLKLFLESEVYVCGFGVCYEELLFWYALQCRLELDIKERKKVVVFLFVANGGEDESDEKESLLRSYDVEVVKIFVTENGKSHGYEVAWYEVIGRLFAIANNVSKLDEKVLIAPAAQKICDDCDEIIRTVRSKTSSSGNPDRCWMNIPVETFSKKGNIAFLCTIDGYTYEYRCSVEKLRKSFEEAGVKIIQNNPVRYSFYLDYETGEIFKTMSSNDTLSVIRLSSIKQF